MSEWPKPIRILHLRADIGKLSDSINMLRHSALDTTSSQVLLSRKRAELESLINPDYLHVGLRRTNSGEPEAGGGGH